MISCSDLRIGNVIMANNRLRKVTMINNDQTLTRQSVIGLENMNNDENNSQAAEQIQPVPLNEAILEQCGFTYQSHFRFWQLINTEQGRTEMDIDSDYNLIDFMRRPIIKNIAWLHQLQNIYYVLLNKELYFDLDRTVLVKGTIRSVANSN